MTEKIPRDSQTETLSVDKEIELAIADAMMVVIAQLLNCSLSEIQSRNIDEKHRLRFLGKRVEFSTRLMCVSASLATAYELFTKHSSLFFKLMIVKSKDSKQFDGARGDKTWTDHALCVVQGVNNLWYAFSPANYNYSKAIASNPIATMTYIYRSTSLEGILSEIKESHGGKWPSNVEDMENYNHPVVRIEEDRDSVLNTTNRTRYIRITQLVCEKSGKQSSDFSEYVIYYEDEDVDTGQTKKRIARMPNLKKRNVKK